ncbi:MAG TPA: hypothetical protein VM238_10140, partial [Phycisphaerae bacterium]|nr:hypothetical protein [Phycisphaerae bacterium]
MNRVLQGILLVGQGCLLVVGFTVTASAAAAADGLQPFRITYEVPTDGLSAIAIDDAEGIRVKNVEADIPRSAGPAQVAWDLKDDFGAYVEPGTYRF